MIKNTQDYTSQGVSFPEHSSCLGWVWLVCLWYRTWDCQALLGDMATTKYLFYQSVDHDYSYRVLKVV